MFKFTKTGVFCLLVVINFCLIQIYINKYLIESETNQEIMDKQLIQQQEKRVSLATDKIDVWRIEIPKISLIANISEGTTKEILNQYVGHFENTSRELGNVGLSAYNRGNNINYFENLKMLKEGDEIKYIYNNFEKIYEIEKCRIIKDTEWQYLEETEENMLTLITFIENEPKYRRCIQAIEKTEIINN